MLYQLQRSLTAGASHQLSQDISFAETKNGVSVFVACTTEYLKILHLFAAQCSVVSMVDIHASSRSASYASAPIVREGLTALSSPCSGGEIFVVLVALTDWLRRSHARRWRWSPSLPESRKARWAGRSC